MAQFKEYNNGNYAGFVVIEIEQIPVSELLDADPEKASAMNRKVFHQMLTVFQKRGIYGKTSIELLFAGVPADEQIVRSRVRIFLILREIGNDPAVIRSRLDSLSDVFCTELENQLFTIRLLDDEQELDSFFNVLGSIGAAKRISVAKNDRVCFVPILNGEPLYYLDIVEPGETSAQERITNAIAGYEHCAVSIQLIPTEYRSEEVTMISHISSVLSAIEGEMRYRQGMQLDPSLQAVSESYRAFMENETEPAFYANILIYASGEEGYDLANKVIHTVEEDKVRANALGFSDVPSVSAPHENF